MASSLFLAALLVVICFTSSVYPNSEGPNACHDSIDSCREVKHLCNATNWKDSMQRSCRKTCGTCGVQVKSVQKNDEVVKKEDEEVEKNDEEVEKNDIGCYDRTPMDCQTQKHKCTKKGWNAYWSKVTCKKTCGLCNRRGCSDLRLGCRLRAHLCNDDRMKSVMHRMCRRTCRLCTVGDEEEVEKNDEEVEKNDIGCHDRLPKHCQTHKHMCNEKGWAEYWTKVTCKKTCGFCNRRDEAVKKNDEAVKKNDEAVKKNDEAVKKNDEAVKKNDEAVKKNDEAVKKNDEAVKKNYEAVKKNGCSISDYKCSSWSYQPGGDMKTVDNVSKEECASLCCKQTKCLGFDYTRDRRCLLMSVSITQYPLKKSYRGTTHCHRKIVPGCKDKRPGYCWGNADWCHDFVFEDYMREECTKTCGYCGINQENGPSLSDEAVKKNDEEFEEFEEACVDSYRYCWHVKDRCDGKNDMFMYHNCPLTCGFC